MKKNEKITLGARAGAACTCGNPQCACGVCDCGPDCPGAGCGCGCDCCR